MPFFSIIIPTYNRAHFLPKAIESVIDQTFTDWELIIVDDGSTDNTKELVENYILKDQRIKYIYQQNAERSAARNNGIKHANSEYICFLDSDDYYLKNRLNNVYHKMKEKNFNSKFFYTAITFDDGKEFKKGPEYQNTEASILDFLAKVTIGTPQVIMAKEILDKEQFSPSLYIGEDFELWLRIGKTISPQFIENEANVIATDHQDRSVNIKRYNAAKAQLKTLQYCFSPDHPGYNISKKIKNNLISVVYFNIARYHMYNQHRAKAIYYIIRAILRKPFHRQSKHRVYCLLILIILKYPEQYTV